ncbi:MAG: hypothetical protein HFI38_06410 [Lachnospiraceae bacterium]|jgi:hypothetical protein|nr:hypothetical protein [Lachnospiraceae bacterium]
MNKSEIRREMWNHRSAAGDVEREREELRKIGEELREEIVTLTRACDGFMTIICC